MTATALGRSTKTGSLRTYLTFLLTSFGALAWLASCLPWQAPVPKGSPVNESPGKLNASSSALITDLPSAAAQVLAAAAPESGATVVLRIRWPARRVASLPATTERLAFQLKGGTPGSQLPQLADLVRPSHGKLDQEITFQLPAIAEIALRVTARAAERVVAQSPWITLPLRRNTRVAVPVELFLATGTTADDANLLSPRIESVVPDRGYPLATVINIKGWNFGPEQGLGAVYFGGKEAANTLSWTASESGESEISVLVPEGARTGPLQLRLGATESYGLVATFNGTGEKNDLWSRNFSVLGPGGDPGTVADGTIADSRMTWDGTRFWALWTRGEAGAMELVAAPLLPDDPAVATALRQAGSLIVTSSPGIALGGMVSDNGGIWLLWEAVSASGSVIKLGYLSPTGLQGSIVLSSSPVVPAYPALARSDDGTLLAVWIDNRAALIDKTTPRPRIYAQAIAANGTLLGQPNPLQRSNGPEQLSALQQVGPPTVATDGSRYLVAWSEAQAGDSQLVLQAVATDSYRLCRDQRAGWVAAGPGSSKFDNIELAAMARSLANPTLLFNPSRQEFAVFYESKFSDADGPRSEIFMRTIARTDLAMEWPIQLVDDSRSDQGRRRCPGELGIPCGQGQRLLPQAVWNGRDYLLAWEFQRDDGEQDIVGARLQPNGLRAVEEPDSPRTFTGSPRSVNELLFTFSPGHPRFSLAGQQTSPRLVWGAGVHLLSWIDREADSGSALRHVLWR
ncbi:MAG: hypothetical protein HY692_07910 [Cyanobacteria bacterium NC_groundwater_1444_Ag_S-0.65um_54_12]|nr:hypothetical protein [Cyanobacteria bacterium NC_groundwater_1444_Ag_S-0.65um_54_12]